MQPCTMLVVAALVPGAPCVVLSPTFPHLPPPCPRPSASVPESCLPAAHPRLHLAALCSPQHLGVSSDALCGLVPALTALSHSASSIPALGPCLGSLPCPCPCPALCLGCLECCPQVKTGDSASGLTCLQDTELVLRQTLCSQWRCPVDAHSANRS